jgi:tetratricopeptide (TPR) repeat protein
MAVDPYAPCPCGSGKKLKFCCSDLAGDIEKISNLVESEQPHAALKHVEHLLAKEPNRPSLLDIRAMLELSLHELEAAEKTLDHFLKVAPENPSAHAQAALLAASRGQTQQAVNKLQDALERTDNSMPQRVFESIGAVGHALLIAGDLVAARAHLLLYAGVAPEGDDRAIELLLRLNLQGNLPLLLRDSLMLQEAPRIFADSNKAAFEEGNRLARRGLWRRAEAEFRKLLNEINPQPAVVYNLALMRGWLGQREAFAAGLHQFARLDVPLDEAVEAEALAQLIDPSESEPKLASVRVTYPLKNEEAAAERLASEKRIERYELDPDLLDEDEVTRPRSTHLLLDRPIPRTGVELRVEDAPNVLAFLSVYGKRTDRGARLEVTTDRGEHFDQVNSLIVEILGDAIGPQESAEVVGEKLASEEALSWRWRLPDDTPPAVRRKLLTERRRKAILEDWTASPRAALDHLAPRDAAKRPDLRIPLLASVLIVEQAAVDPSERELFQQLRDQLDLPRSASIDPDNVNWDRLPLTRIARLDLKNTPLERLMQLFNRAAMSGAAVATLAIAEEIVSSDTLDAGVAPVYRQLIRSEPDPDRALQWTARAREWAARAKQPAGEWALLELEVQIERGDPMGVQNALNDIRANHLNEPGVADATYRLLYTAGLLQPREVPGAMPAGRAPMEAPAAETGRLWTPGQEAPAPAGGKKPVIWTP